jgi:hypothetical protein
MMVEISQITASPGYFCSQGQFFSDEREDWVTAGLGSQMK